MSPGVSESFAGSPPSPSFSGEQQGEARPLALLFGGSFNPPHVGHMRAALEATEALRPARVLFIPSASPPHKKCRDMLPLPFRCDLLRAAIDDLGAAGSLFSVCPVEGERAGPSYTIDTLRILAERNPGMRLAFILGSDKFPHMGHWPGREEILHLADMVILGRSDGGEAIFRAACEKLWPLARPVRTKAGESSQYLCQETGGRLIFLPVPRFGVSATLVRERFLMGRSLDFMVPASVLSLLREQEQVATAVWQG